MIRAISAPGAFLLLTVSCLLSVAQGRELLGTMISDNLNAASHTQGSSDRIAELEAQVKSLMQAFADQQQVNANVQQDLAKQQQVNDDLYDIINALQHGQRLRSASINGDVIDRATVRTIAESVSRTISRSIAETVFAEQAPNIYDALRELNATDAWQNATLANLQSSDAGQNATISSMQASISTLATEVATNTASVKTINIDVGSLQSNVTSINTDIVNITNEVTADEADIQTNSAAIAANAGAIASNSQAIAGLDSELQQLNTTVIPGIAANITSISAQILDIDSELTVLTQNVTEVNSTVISINKTVVHDEADLSSLEGRVQLLEQEEVANGKAIVHNDGLIATNTADIAALRQNLTALNTTDIDIEERVATLEVEEAVNAKAIHIGDQEIQWNAANITLLNETIQNGTIPSGLAEQVDANTASISSLTSTVNSEASRITHLEGMELLEDYYFKQDSFSWAANTEVTLGSFTVSAGHVLDFQASFNWVPADEDSSWLYLYKGSTLVAESYSYDSSGMSMFYREKISYNSSFEFRWASEQSGSYPSGYYSNLWGYKIYDGSSYNFIEG